MEKVKNAITHIQYREYIKKTYGQFLISTGHIVQFTMLYSDYSDWMLDKFEVNWLKVISNDSKIPALLCGA